MNKNQDDFYCIGCGAKIQSTNPLKEGYINIDVLNKKKREDRDFYCKRCFDLKHYNKNTDHLT